MTLFGVLNDPFSRFSGTFSFNKSLKMSLVVVKFIISGTSSHFNLVVFTCYLVRNLHTLFVVSINV